MDSSLSFNLSIYKSESPRHMHLPDIKGICFIYPIKTQLNELLAAQNQQLNDLEHFSLVQVPQGYASLGFFRLDISIEMNSRIAAGLKISNTFQLDEEGKLKGAKEKDDKDETESTKNSESQDATVSPAGNLSVESNHSSTGSSKKTWKKEKQFGLSGNKSMNVNGMIPESKVNLDLDAFVGGESELKFSTALMWRAPIDAFNPRVSRDANESEFAKEFQLLGRGGYTVSGQVGLGGGAGFTFQFRRGKLLVSVHASVCIEYGLKGRFWFEVNLEDVATQFLPAFVYMLRNVDYIKLTEMALVEDFQALCSLQLLTIVNSVPAVGAATIGSEITYALSESFLTETFRVRLMNAINQDPDRLKYSPPESKASAIYMLMETNFWGHTLYVGYNHKKQPNENPNGGWLSNRKLAVMNCLRWVQSKRDFDNVMQHLGLLPGEKAFSSTEEATTALRAFMYSGEEKKGSHNERNLPYEYSEHYYYSNYGCNFERIRHVLPSSVEREQSLISVAEREPSLYTPSSEYVPAAVNVPTDGEVWSGIQRNLFK